MPACEPPPEPSVFKQLCYDSNSKWLPRSKPRCCHDTKLQAGLRLDLGMPIVSITYSQSVPADLLLDLRHALPEIVAECVACPQEPWVGPTKPGDIDLQFHQRHELDHGGLSCVIEIHSKLLPARLADKDERVARAIDQVAPVIDPVSFGVWLLLHEGAWAQHPAT